MSNAHDRGLFPVFERLLLKISSMTDCIKNNKRILHNTILLYIRMLILMSVSLYTSRVVLSILGVGDYGIYNVVGGVVFVLSFLNISMATATQRFLNLELGKNNKKGVEKVFATAQVIHILIAVIILVLAETFGVWFLNNHMFIPKDRIIASNYVFQFTICSFLLTVMSVPYNATIIAHEKMSAFAYITVIEALLKLGIVFLLLVINSDKLIAYSFLMAIVSIIIRIIYGSYCRRHFEECRRFSVKYDKFFFKEMLGFSSWTIFGSLGSISHTQGVAIVLNMFFGVAVNAAQGISMQLNNLVYQFVTSFMTALNPQIVKYYAAKDLYFMQTLIKRGCKMGFFLVAFLVLPLCFETQTILSLWLKEVPEYTVIFTRLVLLTSLCNSFASPLSVAQGATGNIKTYQMVLTILGWMHLPLAWVFFALGFAPYYAMYIYLFLVIIMQMYRIYKVCNSLNISISGFYKDVIIKCFLVMLLSSILPVGMHLLVPYSLFSRILTFCMSAVMVIISVFVVGVNNEERNKIFKFIRSKTYIAALN